MNCYRVVGLPAGYVLAGDNFFSLSSRLFRHLVSARARFYRGALALVFPVVAIYRYNFMIEVLLEFSEFFCLPNVNVMCTPVTGIFTIMVYTGKN